MFFGVLVFPILITAGLYWLSGKLWRSQNQTLKLVCVFLLLLSLILDVPVDTASRAPFNHLPLYYNLFCTAY